jgi:hypothetical protein
MSLSIRSRFLLRIMRKAPNNGFGGCQDSCRLFRLCRLVTKVLFGGPFLLWIESYDFNRFPVASFSTPAVWVLLSCLGVNFFPFVQDRFFSAVVPIIRCHKANFAVQVIGVVPLHKAIDPALCVLLTGKGFRGILCSAVCQRAGCTTLG